MGYNYAITLSIPADIAQSNDFGICVVPDETFGDSVTVWTDDLNLLHKSGSFCIMFDPLTLAQAKRKATEWIDAYYAASHSAADRCAQHEAWLFKCANNQARKFQMRKNRLAARSAS